MWYIFSTVINAIYCRKPAFIIVDSKAGFFMSMMYYDLWKKGFM